VIGTRSTNACPISLGFKTSRALEFGQKLTVPTFEFELLRDLLNLIDGSKGGFLLRQSIDRGLGEISNDRALSPVHPYI
jgi:hypothetical protein